LDFAATDLCKPVFLGLSLAGNVGKQLLSHYMGVIPRSLKGTQDWDFFCFDFEICISSLLVMSKYEDFGKKIFDQAIFGGDTIFPLSLGLSGIEFSLVWD
jgi:hypothetical protein